MRIPLGKGSLALLFYALMAVALWLCLPVQPRGSVTLPDKPHKRNSIFPMGSAVGIALAKNGNDVIVTTRQYNDEPANWLQPLDVSCTLRVYDRRRDSWRMVLPGLPPLEVSMISPNGALLAALIAREGRNEAVSTYLYLWDVETGQQIERILVSDRKSWGDIAFSPDGNTLAYTSNLNQRLAVNLWDVPTRHVRTVLPGQFAPLAFAPDGGLLATANASTWGSYAVLDYRVKVWDVVRECERVVLEDPQIFTDPTVSVICMNLKCLAFSRDGSRLGVIELIAGTGGHEAVLRATTSSEAKRRSSAEMIREWDTSTGKLLSQRFTDWDNNVAHSPHGWWEGAFHLTRATDQAFLSIPLTGEKRFGTSIEGAGDGDSFMRKLDFPEPDGPQYRFDPAGDGASVVVSQYQGTRFPSHFWTFLVEHFPQFQSSKPEKWTDLRLFDTATGRLLAFFADQNFAAFSPDGKTLATVSADDTTIYFWDVPPTKNWLAILGLPICPLAFFGLIKRAYR